MHTVTASNQEGHLVSFGAERLSRPYLCPMYNPRPGQRPRTREIDRALMTIPASKSPAGLASPFVLEYYGNGKTHMTDTPLPTVTTRDRFALCVPDAWPWRLDVRYRMLQLEELKQAQGFPADYEIAGSTKADITEQIGNAVPVNMARALVANLLASDDPSLSSFGGGLAADPEAEVPPFADVVEIE